MWMDLSLKMGACMNLWNQALDFKHSSSWLPTRVQRKYLERIGRSLIFSASLGALATACCYASCSWPCWVTPIGYRGMIWNQWSSVDSKACLVSFCLVGAEPLQFSQFAVQTCYSRSHTLLVWIALVSFASYLMLYQVAPAKVKLG